MNTYSISTRRVVQLLAVVALFAAMFGAFTAYSTDVAASQEHKVDICHSTDGESYTPLSVAKSAIVPEGHSGHEYDIIPPFEYESGSSTEQYDGKNWGDDGQAIWDNECDVDGHGDDNGGGDNEEPDEDPMKIVAHKIVCTDESELPNWGEGADKITADTAADWVDEYDSCEFAEGWEFEWVHHEDGFDPGDTLVGEAGDPWTTFGPTDEDGMTMVEIDDDLEEGAKVWVREVLQEGFIPFTHEENSDNSDDVSAEMYCHKDVKNYDNYDRISGAKHGKTFYCVAWNSPVEEPNEDPWCSFEGEVIDYTPDEEAKTNGGNPVNPDRRHIEAVETVAPYANFGGSEGNDWNVSPLDFFSLGIEGFLIYEFTEKVAFDQPGDDIAIYEITGGTSNTDEKVIVSVSENGIDFVEIGTITGDGALDISGTGLDYVKYVRLDDDSAGIQGSNGDGYDVDAIVILDGSCGEEPEEPEYGPYCGDGEVNQEWEMCDGYLGDEVGKGENGVCNAQCQYEDANQCTDLALARIVVDDVVNEGEGNMSSDLFLGSDSNMIPAGVWFALHFNGSFYTDPDMIGDYDDVPGFAVERREGSLHTLAHGSLPKKSKEHIDGHIEFWNVFPTAQISDTKQDRIEKPFNGTGVGKYKAGNDEIWLDDDKSHFWLTTTTADDGFVTEYSDVPVCDECLVEGYKFDENGVPLYGWTIGLAIEHHEYYLTVANDYGDDYYYEYHTIGEDMTDENGYYCIAPEKKDDYEDEDGPYLDVYDYYYGDYVVYEELKKGWEPVEAVVDGATTTVSSDSFFDVFVEVSDPYEYDEEEPLRVDFYNQETENGHECLVEGFKYNASGTPLSGWTIGLYGTVYDEATSTTGTIATDVTDESGIYCLYAEIEEGSDYRVYELLQEGWGVVEAVVNDATTTPSSDEMHDVFVGISLYGETTPTVDFYNEETENDNGGGDPTPNGTYECSDSADNDNDGLPDALDPDCHTDGDNNNPDSYDPFDDDEQGPEEGGGTINFTPLGGGGGQVAGTSTGEVLGESLSCGLYLRDYLHINADNDPFEVRKLQMFLNAFINAGLEVNGVFDEATFEAVKQFQITYGDAEVLGPWVNAGWLPNTQAATGYVYLTTRRKINMLVCPLLNIPVPSPLEPGRHF